MQQLSLLRLTAAIMAATLLLQSESVAASDAAAAAPLELLAELQITCASEQSLCDADASCKACSSAMTGLEEDLLTCEGLNIWLENISYEAQQAHCFDTPNSAAKLQGLFHCW
eukprot:TRINITY_DN69_c0_g1_i5.p5 TRINITY_DN69_c0_g1~~TRINITY_DN69_c0_g1_i5.p5  ORF type:complete len:113 (-),score=31.34 TRINITY_DN69_c0_g1_i5:2348-2686(-)